MTIKSLYPASRPALGIDFAKTKRLDPRVTYTRASTATYVDNGGVIRTAGSGVARFDHNPSTGESLGLLVEEARTNLVLYSDTLNGGAWGTLDATLALNSALSPASTFDASLLTDNVTTTFHGIRYPITSGGTTVFSVYVKYLNARYIQFTDDVGDSGTWNVDLIGQTASRVSGSSNSSLTIQPMPNNWMRIFYQYTWGANNRWPNLNIVTSLSSVRRESRLGVSGNGVYLWGAQLEAGSFPTSYIPTTTATVTRAADVATLANTGSSIFPTSAFTTVNSPFGTAGGGSTVKLVGPTVKRTAVYSGDLTQAQINALAGVNDGFWRWRVLGSSFALPSFTTDGSVTVDWGDGVVETLTTAVHTFTNGGGYHDIGFRLNSGTFFRPLINDNATYRTRLIAVGPAPVSMKINASGGFFGCTALKTFDTTVDCSGGTSVSFAWYNCSSLTSFPLINTSGVTDFNNAWRVGAFDNPILTSFPLLDTAAGTNFSFAWRNCSGLTSFPLINTAAGTNFQEAWAGCAGLTSFPLINTAAVTNFQGAWQSCTSLTSFPLINTGAGTNFTNAWNNSTGLTSFPLINTANGTSFSNTWTNLSLLTSFPAINTAAGTNFINAWYGCSGLTSFPLINTGAGTNFSGTWYGCSSLTSFPLINTSSATNFLEAWRNCSSLTSFPLLSTGAVTNFGRAWQGCSGLTSFPLINAGSATSFSTTWYGCSSLTSFPANMFNTTGTLIAGAFFDAFTNCALTATSIENILTSLVTNGQSNITLTLSGGTNAGATTWTTAANTAYATLITRGWTITRNA